MNKKTILTTLLFFLPLAFLEQTKPEASSIARNKSVNAFDLTNTNQSPLIIKFSSSENNVEIKSCWEKGDLASQKRYCSSSMRNLENF
tara:strand:- start:477 stop:740 length:264 start_codon:yes stop_codon:yes gene_type:complete